MVRELGTRAQSADKTSLFKKCAGLHLQKQFERVIINVGKYTARGCNHG
jgi:hypothetical protein